MYSAGLYSGLVEPKYPAMTTATRPSTPIVPPTIRGHGDRATERRMGAARRGYSTALAPTWSPANSTTRTNEMITTPAAANR
jgi:hypothetical protein